jgi:general secretion pathway protein D
VNLSDDLKLGIDWQWTNSGEYNQTATLSPNTALATNSFSYMIEKTGRITAAFKALAENGRASILSSPSVISANGKKSKTTTTVEYRDIGVILTFTPFINDDGLVTMEIEQEVSDINTAVSGSNPTFFKRSITTNLVASQDQSIVLGGLVKEKKSLDRSGIPFFYKIPLIGWLFGSREDNVTRNELLIFITPRVIRTVEEGVQLSRDFEERVAQLKARMREAQGMRLKGDKLMRP